MPLNDVTRQAVAGYFAGGYNGTASGYISRIDKMAFPSDTLTVNADSLTSAGFQIKGFANSGVAGYVCGVGYGPSGEQTTVNKVTFATDTRSTTTAMSIVRRSAGGFANNGVAGYIAGGFDGADYRSQVDKFAFPTDTRSTTTALTDTRIAFGSFQNNGVAGYSFGGVYAGAGSSTHIEKMVFSADTVSALSATLTTSLVNSVGFADSGVAGYSLGGNYGASYYTNVDRISLVNDTKSVLTALSAAVTTMMQGFANTAVAGYAGGGDPSAGSATNTVKKMSFPSETISNTTNLTGNVQNGAGFANEGTF
jgi:hypothetical protein